jgi:hypothetical protein
VAAGVAVAAAVTQKSSSGTTGSSTR